MRFELEDGTTAHCQGIARKDYKNAHFSSGPVEGIEPDTPYLQIKFGEEEPTTMFMRPGYYLTTVIIDGVFPLP